MSFLKITIITLFVALLSAVALQAQTATGEVNGTVTDPNGASVPGAMVKLINQAISERFKLQFRAEMFNVFNIINWNTPENANLTINSGTTVVNGVRVGVIAPNVGRITTLAQGTTPRQIQFGLRLTY